MEQKALRGGGQRRVVADVGVALDASSRPDRSRDEASLKRVYADPSPRTGGSGAVGTATRSSAAATMSALIAWMQAMT